jgi:hypothetical protein
MSGMHVYQGRFGSEDKTWSRICLIRIEGGLHGTRDGAFADILVRRQNLNKDPTIINRRSF